MKTRNNHKNQSCMQVTTVRIATYFNFQVNLRVFLFIENFRITQKSYKHLKLTLLGFVQNIKQPLPVLKILKFKPTPNTQAPYFQFTPKLYKKSAFFTDHKLNNQIIAKNRRLLFLSCLSNFCFEFIVPSNFMSLLLFTDKQGLFPPLHASSPVD